MIKIVPWIRNVYELECSGLYMQCVSFIRSVRFYPENVRLSHVVVIQVNN